MGSYRAVVADDEEVVNNILTESLKRTEYFQEIGSFMDGNSALGYCTEHPDVKVAIVDLSMPLGVPGNETSGGGLYLVEGLREKKHPVYPDGIVVVSGYSGRDVLKHFEDLDVYRFLDKPFSLKEIESITEKIMSKMQIRER